MPLGAQVDDGVGEEAVVGERLHCEAEVVRERGLEESEALGWVGVQIAHRDGTTLQHKPQPSSVRVWCEDIKIRLIYTLVLYRYIYISGLMIICSICGEYWLMC